MAVEGGDSPLGEGGSCLHSHSWGWLHFPLSRYGGSTCLSWVLKTECIFWINLSPQQACSVQPWLLCTWLLRLELNRGKPWEQCRLVSIARCLTHSLLPPLRGWRILKREQWQSQQAAAASGLRHQNPWDRQPFVPSAPAVTALHCL